MPQRTGPDPRHTRRKGAEDRLTPESSQGQSRQPTPSSHPRGCCQVPYTGRRTGAPQSPRMLPNTTFRGQLERQDRPWKCKTEKDTRKTNNHFRKKNNHIQGTDFQKDRSEIPENCGRPAGARGHLRCSGQASGAAGHAHATNRLSPSDQGVRQGRGACDERPPGGQGEGCRRTHRKTLQEKGPTDQGVSWKRAPRKIRD